MKPTTRSWMNEWLGRRRCQIDCCWQIQQESKAAGGTFCFKIRVVGEIPDNNAVDDRQEEEEEEIPEDAVVSRTWMQNLEEEEEIPEDAVVSRTWMQDLEKEEEEATDSWSLCYRFNQDLKGKT